MIPYIISNEYGSYVSQNTTDAKNGLGRLSECISCKITETLDNQKTAVLRVPSSALHANKIVRGGLLMFDDHEHPNQLWRIEKIQKTFANNLIEIRCNHISYDLNKLACKPFNATGTASIMSSLNNQYISYKPFVFSSNIVNTTATVSIQVPTYYREIIGGIDGNVIEALGCEVEWDNLNVRFVARRGSERDVSIRYGANIIDAKQEESIADVVNIIYGYVKKGDNPVIVGLPYFVGTLPDYPLIATVDLTNTFASGETINPTTIRTHAQAWASENDVLTPKVNFSIDYLSLSAVDSKKYAALYSLQLGDTISVILPTYGEYRARVSEVVYDVLNNRIEKISVGARASTLADTIADMDKKTSMLRAYPVGSFYTSSGDTNPAAIFGGEWALVSSTATSYTFRRTK